MSQLALYVAKTPQMTVFQLAVRWLSVCQLFKVTLALFRDEFKRTVRILIVLILYSRVNNYYSLISKNFFTSNNTRIHIFKF